MSAGHLTNAAAFDQWFAEHFSPEDAVAPPQAHTATAASPHTHGPIGSRCPGDDQRTPSDAQDPKACSGDSGDSPPVHAVDAPRAPGLIDPASVEDGANLFVTGLPPSVDDEALEGAFAKFGEVLSAKVMLSLHNAASRGFGFVLFRHAADAAKARAAMHGHAIQGHPSSTRLQVSVSRHKGDSVESDSQVAYVRNVPVNIGRQRLEEYLSRFGTVEKLQVKATRTTPVPTPAASSSGGGSQGNGESKSPQTTSGASNESSGSGSGDTSSKASKPPSVPFANAPQSVALANIVVRFATSAAARACVAGTHGKKPFTECAIPLLAKVEEPQHSREMRRQRGGKADEEDAAPATTTTTTCKGGAVQAVTTWASKPVPGTPDAAVAGAGKSRGRSSRAPTAVPATGAPQPPTTDHSAPQLPLGPTATPPPQSQGGRTVVTVVHHLPPGAPYAPYAAAHAASAGYASYAPHGYAGYPPAGYPPAGYPPRPYGGYPAPYPYAYGYGAPLPPHGYGAPTPESPSAGHPAYGAYPAYSSSYPAPYPARPESAGAPAAPAV